LITNNIYKIEFLPIAKQDIDEIIYYVSNNLKNLSAAKNLSKGFIESVNSILTFPFGLPVYKVEKKLENEYRSIKIKNFLMFYTINENEKIITIVRVLYQKMDINNILE
jgi:plasmid stabilization system protein ParE